MCIVRLVTVILATDKKVLIIMYEGRLFHIDPQVTDPRCDEIGFLINSGSRITVCLRGVSCLNKRVNLIIYQLQFIRELSMEL